MFASVISRDGGAPWPACGMTSALWLERPINDFAIRQLIATQPGVMFEPLINPQPSYSGDPYPHVVIWRGGRYLEDGHHRVIRAALAGQTLVKARYIRL